jgi:hypothetical protein
MTPAANKEQGKRYGCSSLWQKAPMLEHDPEKCAAVFRIIL